MTEALRPSLSPIVVILKAFVCDRDSLLGGELGGGLLHADGKYTNRLLRKRLKERTGNGRESPHVTMWYSLNHV